MIRLGIKDSSFEALLLSVYRYIYNIYNRRIFRGKEKIVINLFFKGT